LVNQVHLHGEVRAADGVLARGVEMYFNGSPTELPPTPINLYGL
jgi:hypothetical protein